MSHLNLDPTRTTLLRNAFVADMHRRMVAIRRAVIRLVVEEDAFGLRRANAIGTPIGQATVTSTISLDSILPVTNFNPNHDSLGRFSSGPGGPATGSGGEKKSIEKTHGKILAEDVQDGYIARIHVDPNGTLDNPQRIESESRNFKGAGVRTVQAPDGNIVKVGGWLDWAEPHYPSDYTTRSPEARAALELKEQKRWGYKAAYDANTKDKDWPKSPVYKPSAAPVINTRWSFASDDKKIAAYQEWLKGEVDKNLLTVDPANKNFPWIQPYIGKAYKKGYDRAYMDTQAAKGEPMEFIEGGKAAFLKMSFEGPVAQEKLRILGTRAYTGLKGITADMDKEMTRILAQGLAQGKSPHDLGRDLAKSIDGLDKKRAATIARTEIVHAHNEGQLDSFEAMNVEGVGVKAEWSTAHDGKVCPLCAPLEGIILTIKEARGMLPRHPNCITGDMRVVAPGVKALLKTYYTGEIIELVTVGGRHITVTPAHILLTKYGFARAEAVYNGLDLAIDTGLYGGVEAPDYKHAVPCIAEEFIAGSKALGVPAVSVPCAPEDLHNEGRFCDKKIDIVYADGVLGDARQSHFGETGLHGTLPVCGGGVGGLALGTFAKILRCAAHTSDGSMGRCRDALAFLLSGVLEAEQVRLGAGAGLHTGVLKTFTNNVPTDMELLRDCLNRHPILKKLEELLGIDFCSIMTTGAPNLATQLIEAGFKGIPFDAVVCGDAVEGPPINQMQFDQVCSVRKYHVASLAVYDAQTLSTVYSIGGIIASNCRCAWIPADVGEEDEGTTETTWAGPEQGLEEPGTLPTGKTTGQVWSKDEVGARIRQSIKAEHPKLTTPAARAASRWVGADLKSIAGKVKPGTKAAIEAAAAEKAAKALAQAAAKEAAEKAAAKAVKEQSLKIKAGMAQAKLGELDSTAYTTGVSGLPELTKSGAVQAAVGEEVFLTVEEIEAVLGATAARGVPRVAAQVDALMAKVLEKKAIKEAAEEAAKVAAATAKKLTDDAAAAVGKWTGPGVDVTALDHADYSAMPGWAPVSGKTQSYGTILFDNEGRVLMRAPKGGYGGVKWTFAKGDGIAPGTTALKELAEETGHKGAIFDVLPNSYKGQTTKTNFFLGKSVGYDAALMDAETDAVKWMTFDEAKKAIALSNAKVAARDLEILQDAYNWIALSDGKGIANLANGGATKLKAIKDTAAKAAHSHKVKVGMAQKHFTKPQFGGGIVDADYASATKQKLGDSGINKVLSEKGWHLGTVPNPEVFTSADDIVGQKAAFDALKKAPKGTPSISAWTKEEIKVGGKWSTTGDWIPAPTTAPVPPPTATVPFERDLKKIKDLPGSIKPYLAAGPDGKKWVVKDVSGSGIAPAHLRSEATADELYRTLGFDVPKGKVIDSAGGPMKVTEFLEGGQTLAEWKVGKKSAEIKAMYKEIQKGFVSDALFANHDVAGLAYDNIFIQGGKAYRIDNGGALAYRAQGGAKRGWGPKVAELESMRDKSTNAVTASIYDGITDDEINRQIRHVVQNRDALLAAVPDEEVRAVLAARIDNLQARLPAVAARKAGTGGTRAAEYGVTAQTPERVVKARSNGVNLAVDREDIEDNNVLAWEELSADGKPITMIQMKVTKKGSDKIIESLGDEFKAAKSLARASAAPTSTIHPEDTYHAAFQKMVKTVNKHAKDGAYNEGAIKEFNKLKLKLAKELPGATGDTKKMLKHYEDVANDIKEAMYQKSTTTAVNNGKLFTPYIHAPPPPPVEEVVVGRRLRRDVRIRRDGAIDFRTTKFSKGVGTADGQRNKFDAEDAYVLDMGEGIEIHYLPNDGGFRSADGRALHGTVRVSVPAKTSEATLNKAMGMLREVGLNTAPPSEAFEEALYLHRGVYINKRHKVSSYTAIWEDKNITDEERVVKMKAWIKDNMSVDVDKVPGYAPAGTALHADGSGFRHWMRWDVTPDKVKKEMEGYTLFHNPSSGLRKTIEGVLDSGGEFTSTTGRIRKGVNVHSTGGMSSSSDINTGGASYFFTRITKPDSTPTGIHFKIENLARQDLISYSGDNWGRISNIEQRGTNISAWKSHAAHSSNESIFKEGFGISDLDIIVANDTGEKERVIKAFTDRGITTLPDGRQVKDIVMTTTERTKQMAKGKK